MAFRKASAASTAKASVVEVAGKQVKSRLNTQLPDLRGVRYDKFKEVRGVAPDEEAE